MKSTYPIATMTLPASADLQYPKRFVKINSSGQAALCGANEQAVGVLEHPIPNGESATILFAGIVLVEAGNSIAAGAEVVSDASGKAIAASAITATATAAAATAAGTAVTIPSGSTDVTSTAAQPTLSITDPTITVTQPTVTMTGSAMPQKILGIALDAASTDGDLIRVKLR